MNLPVVAFLTHVAPKPNPQQEAWYGVYFESTRWQHCSMAEIIHIGYKTCQCNITISAIERILDMVPYSSSLIIETDDFEAAKQLNDALLTRRRGHDSRSEMEKSYHSYRHRSWCDERLTPVINRIDTRTLRGQSFVDIIDSSRDPSAANGLAAARDLAQKRMEADYDETASS